MSNRHTVFFVFLSMSACRVIAPPPAPDAPKIESFVSDRQHLANGETARLSWAVTGATELSVTDAEGSSVKLSGDVNGGSATVAPSRSTVYVLHATGKGGRATAFVQIAVDEPLKDTFLLAVPSLIGAGDTAQLLWQARGASRVTLTGDDGFNQTLTGGLGTVEVTPAVSTQYVLTAETANGAPPSSSLARVEVTPLVNAFNVFAQHGAYPGETVRLSWDTLGATSVTLSERTFGQLTTISGAGAARGEYSYTLPATLPNGFPYADGFVLRFTLTARGGGTAASKTLAASVGDGPVIDQLTFPSAVTRGGRFTIAWRTVAATQVRVLQGTQVVFDTQDPARVADGNVELPSPAQPTDFTVVASNASGLSDTRTQQLRVVAPPSIASFTLTANVSGSGAPATARWETSNATRVKLRMADGASLLDISSGARVANGTATVKPITTADVVFEAYNAAGDAVSETRTITVAGPFLTLDPEVFIRGDGTLLSWALSSLGVLELVGLPGVQGAEIIPQQNSGNFIDLRDTIGATDVRFDDALDGVARVSLPRGFELWLQGRRFESLYVGVNGFLAPTSSISGVNTDLTLASSPELIAPLWDDFQLNAGSRVVTGVRNRPGTNEQLFVVQWDSLERVGEPGSSYTFEAQLYESGQVVFVYGPFSGSATSATVGLKLGATTRQYAFNDTLALVAPDLELDFFTVGSSEAVVALQPNDATPVTFYARTATELLPARVFPRVFGPGDLDITEAMPLPDPITGSSGQWFEVRNTTSATMNLSGLTVLPQGATTGFTIPDGVLVDAGAYLVLGQSADQLANGGAPVDVEYGFDVQLTVPGGVELQASGTTLGSFTWATANQSTSVIANVLPSNILYAPGYTPPACPRTETYGSTGAYGTPGRANDGSCGGGYNYSIIPGAFVSAPAGSAIPNNTWTSTDLDTGYGSRALPVPFTYWGTTVTSIGFSPDGVLRMGGTFTSAQTSNGTAASTAQPNGTVAVFWDDLDLGDNPGTLNLWREGNRTIVSWENNAIFSFSLVTNINFQVHLLDTGVIEFHYGNMTGDAARTSGSLATVWLESPDGNVVLPFSINQQNISSNMGIRFTPR